MTIRVCLQCKRFTAFRICKACGKETEEWKDGPGPDELVGEVIQIAAVKSTQGNTKVEAAPAQEKEKGPRKAKADQGTEG